MIKILLIAGLLFIGLFSSAQPTDTLTLPKGFVYIHDVIPNIVYDIRYYSDYNFMGRRVDGYEQPVAILSIPATQALQKVQKELNKNGLGLKIFDAYRPQTAVNHFIRWSRIPTDTLMKSVFYPDLAKPKLFQLGYIASHSGHSRGSTVDLTIINLQTGQDLDMGAPFDFFGEISHHDSRQVTAQQQANRQLLKNIMMRHGFQPYSEEWWHYTLRAEPFPEIYFDFKVR
ncbi:M15 family metallopeptidase [Sphingobacterium sp. SGG-5]|uniref:M15 family metallopeptidase n=1 Tax=Sphingobacterium sp. SGG-5 TaxID=2710881 RepID=UPI0013ED64FF|nr:M15 family metallopeptidase [Sphingobacterium sp. SGG-5]NGM60660.1 M15 family metallopeptidase [Sphingobacterium sp. SGG-5]